MPIAAPRTLTAPDLIPTAEDFGLLPKAFSPPASASTELPADIDPVSFRPPQTGATGQRIERFHDFRNDPLFGRSTRALAERLDELSRFASTQCGRQGPIVTGALESFKRKLQERPDPHFGDALPVIHGAGKRGLDEFCALMRQPGIDAAARRVTLQEFASKLDRCGAYIGESMVRLPLTLRLAQGGLHARHGQLMEQVTEQTLLSLVREPRPDGRPHAPGMEPHIVQQLRRELGLPGGANEDHFAHSQLVSSRLIGHAREALEFELHPGTMAGRLAVDAMEELKAGLRKELGDDLSTVDPMDAHALPFQRALDALNQRYGGIRAGSLVEAANEDFTAGRLRTDPSLLALDLRDEMARLELAPPARRDAIASWTEADGQTTLCHVDDRIFFLSHRARGSPDPELSSVTLGSLARVPDRRPPHPPDPELWRGVLARTMVEVTPAQDLIRLPPKWLLNEPIVLRFLARLPPAARDRWLARTDLPAGTRAAVSQWRQQEAARQQEARITAFKAALRDNDPVRLSEMTQSLLRDSPRDLADVLRSGVLEQSLSAGQSVSGEVLIGALHALTLDGVLHSSEQWRLLRRALTDATLTHAPARTCWLSAVEAALKDKLLSPGDVRSFLLKDDSLDAFRRTWVRSQHPPGAIKGWVSLGLDAARLGIIDRRDVGDALASAVGPLRPDNTLLKQSERLAELMLGFVDAERDGTEMTRLMKASIDVRELIRTDPEGSSLGAYMDAAITARKNKRITTAQFLELVAPGKPAQLPLFAKQGREEAREEILAIYLRKLVLAAVAGVLPVQTLADMLLCKDSDKRPVIAGASKAASELLVKTIDDLELNKLVKPKDAHQLQARILKAVRAKH